MIICKTPLRISFFGGGSDYIEWTRNRPGMVLSTTIDKYVYLTLRDLPKFFEHNYRIVYSKIENVKKIDDIKHHAIKGILKNFNYKKGLEIHYDSDLPARSGMGSSSAFVVSLINCLHKMVNKNISRKKLSLESIFYEQKILRETVGMQDQIACAYGGFNEITFCKGSGFCIKPINFDNKEILQNNLFLVFTGISRTANDIANTFVNDLNYKKKNHIREILNHAKIGKKLLKNCNFDDFGLLLAESWNVKKKLSNSISNLKIDNIYNEAMINGAIGGKLLGAGGGGFFLFYVPKKNQDKFCSSFLHKYTNINFNFENSGSTIIKF